MPDKIMSILAEATGGKCTDKEIQAVNSIKTNPLDFSTDSYYYG